MASPSADSSPPKGIISLGGLHLVNVQQLIPISLKADDIPWAPHGEGLTYMPLSHIPVGVNEEAHLR